MLSAQQISALRDKAERIADPITEYLLTDIARRIAEAARRNIMGRRGLMQEWAIRAQKRRVMVDEAAGDGERLAQDKTRLNVLHQRYREFSGAAGLRTQYERTEVAGFGERASHGSV